MAKRTKFHKIAGLTASASEVCNLIEMTGPPKAIDRLKTRLTATNKSIGWQLRKTKEKLDFFKKQRDLSGSDKYQERIDFFQDQHDELSDNHIQEYFHEDNGVVYTPAGYWYLAENINDNLHLNTKIEPFLIEGLRPYQEEAVLEAMKYKRSTLALATGLGKSRIIASICKSMAKAGKRTMVVVPTEYLVGQIVETVGQYCDSVTGASSKRKPALGSTVMACTVGTAQKYIDNYDAVVVDESHHNPASTWIELLSKAVNAEYVYNLTATPFRTDGLDIAIHAFGGPIVYDRDAKWGIENGWLSNFDAHIVRIATRNRKGEQVICSSKSLATTAYKKLVDNKYFLEIVKDQLLKAVENGYKCMVITKTKSPLFALRNLCGKEFDVATAEFKKPLNDFKAGKSNVLPATYKLVSEGVDIPDADVLFLLTQNSSDVTTLQALGRVLRKGGKKPIVVDFVAEGYEQFERAAIKRAQIFNELADSVKVTKI